MARIKGVYKKRDGVEYRPTLAGEERWLETSTGYAYESEHDSRQVAILHQEGGEWVLGSSTVWVPVKPAPVPASVPAALAPEHEYVVFVQGGQSPTKRHKSFTDAETEAKRLCEKEKTKTVLVLRVDAEVKCAFRAKVHVL